MFGWLKRRLVREHRKLLWQNERAANDGEMMFRLRVGGFDDAVDALKLMGAVSRSYLEQGVPAEGLPDSTVEQCLRMNKNLRRFSEVAFEEGPSKFDRRYAPLGGWASYFEQFE